MSFHKAGTIFIEGRRFLSHGAGGQNPSLPERTSQDGLATKDLSEIIAHPLAQAPLSPFSTVSYFEFKIRLIHLIR